MPISDSQLAELAALARLAPPAEPERVRNDLASILAYVDRLAAFDDPSVAPLRQPNLAGDAIEPDALRPDATAGEGLSAAQLASLAPGWREERFEVPRTVEHG